MTGDLTLEQLPMTLGYFRLILRSFGDTAERQLAILAGTGVTEAMAANPRADISLFQQVRQIENVSALFGEGWPMRAPELWNPASHGPLGVAALAARDFAGMVEVLARFGHVRAPFYKLTCRRSQTWSQLSFDLTVPIDERLWRPMIEISFMGIRTLFASVLVRPPAEAQFLFACAAPAHADQVRQILGESVTFDAPHCAVRFPTAWLTLQSPFADPMLHGAAMAELHAAAQRLGAASGLRGRVERLLSTLPPGRLNAAETARLMGVSRRTLVRRLAEVGVGYRQLADNELRARAERLLCSGVLTRAQIAEELGYSEPTSFSRARRRWFGRSPQPKLKAAAQVGSSTRP